MSVHENGSKERPMANPKPRDLRPHEGPMKTGGTKRDIETPRPATIPKRPETKGIGYFLSEADPYMDHLEQRVAELEEELDRYRNGYQGGCMTCEPVAERNNRLRNDLHNMTAACVIWQKRAEALEQRAEAAEAKLDRAVKVFEQVENILDAEVIRTDEDQTDEEIAEIDPVWWAMILVARTLREIAALQDAPPDDDPLGPVTDKELDAARTDVPQTVLNSRQVCPDCDKLREERDRLRWWVRDAKQIFKANTEPPTDLDEITLRSWIRGAQLTARSMLSAPYPTIPDQGETGGQE